MAEPLQVFDHAGLLVNEPPGLVRVALHLVVRRASSQVFLGAKCQLTRARFPFHCDAHRIKSKENVFAIAGSQTRGCRHGLLQLSSRLYGFIHRHHVSEHRQEHQAHDDPETPVFMGPSPRGLIIGFGRVRMVVPVMPTLFMIAQQFNLPVNDVLKLK